jgi:hypothetical protein
MFWSDFFGHSVATTILGRTDLRSHSIVGVPKPLHFIVGFNVDLEVAAEMESGMETTST